MTIIIPYKTYETKDSEAYFIRLSLSTSGRLLGAGIFQKIVKKKRPFFKSKLGGGHLLEFLGYVCMCIESIASSDFAISKACFLFSEKVQDRN